MDNIKEECINCTYNNNKKCSYINKKFQDLADLFKETINTDTITVKDNGYCSNWNKKE